MPHDPHDARDTDDARDVSPSRPTSPTPLMRLAAEVFGLTPRRGRRGHTTPQHSQPGHAPDRPPDRPPPDPTPLPGQVVAYLGPSGGGKSMRLDALTRRARRDGWHVTDVPSVALPPVACVDQFGGEGTAGDLWHDLALATGRLGLVGLAEARVLLKRPDELSDGQRWRLRLAVACFGVCRRHGRSLRRGIVPRRELLVCDEFCAVLDRVTACVVARSLRRTVDRLTRVGAPLAAAVATSHDDLTDALAPDAAYRCEQ